MIKMLPKHVLILLAFLLPFLGFNQTTQKKSLLLNFRFLKEANAGFPSDFYGFTYKDTLISIIVPEFLNVSNAKASFDLQESDSVLVNGSRQIPGITGQNYNAPINCTLYKNGLVQVNIKVQVVKTGLPLLVINTDNGDSILSKEDYIRGNLSVFAQQLGGETKTLLPMQIRGRGNSTWLYEKKPYRIKLNSRQTILGMPAHRDWVLLANYGDKSLLRNQLALEISKRFGLPFTPRSQFVDVVINNQYQGNYLLTEQIKVDPNRVNITEMKVTDTSGINVTGGYLLEADARLDGPNWFYTKLGVPLVAKEPENIQVQQGKYIVDYINETEQSIFAANFDDTLLGYASKIKVPNFVNWYLHNELLKNNDANFFSSAYLFKERNQKLGIGPVWDYDLAAGNVNYNYNDYPQGWWVRGNIWYDGLFRDLNFRNNIIDRWNSLLFTQTKTLPNHIDSLANSIHKSQQLNYMVWPTLDSLIFPNPAARGAFEAEVDALKNWLNIRIQWIENQFNPVALQSFRIHTPQDSTYHLSAALGNNHLPLSWSPAGNGAYYKIFLASTDSSIKTRYELFADKWAADTLFSLTAFHADTINQLFNQHKADTVQFTWTVYAYSGIDSFEASNGKQLLGLIISNVLTPFKVKTPAHNSLILYHQTDSFPVFFTWENASNLVSYELFFDSAQAGIKPFVNWVKLKEKTYQTYLSISIQELIQLFSQNGYYLNDTIEVKWKVKSNYLHYTEWSENENTIQFIKQKPTGIADNQLENLISIYPNPAQDYFAVRLSHLSEPCTLSLMNISGHVLQQKKADAHEIISFNTSELSPGLYVLQIETSKQKVFKKIVIY